MIVLTSNNTGTEQRSLAAAYPGRVGLLISTGRGAWRTPRGVPYALDNGAFAAHLASEPWDEAGFVKLLDSARDTGIAPEWVVVPDAVGKRAETLRQWRAWAPRVAEYGWPLAFAAQDGMQTVDVPRDASVIFIGGSKRWKWRSIWDWCRAFPRVHVGGINTYRRLWSCHDAGVLSCDGTGWFRGGEERLAGLRRYLDESSANGRAQARLII